jgi:exodeoxyribonuclease VII large subunit
MTQLAFDTSRRIYTVSELTGAIKAEIEKRFAGLWVEGEISNLRAVSSGHVYFTLKDEASQVRAVLFKSRARRVRFAPADGLHVLAFATLEVYAARGEYQLVCEILEPKGLGALQLAFEQLKGRLAAEGLFDAGRKRPLPMLPRRVGLITSPTGAAVRDFLRVLTRRFADVHVLVYPVRVHGEAAAPEIARALSDLNRLGGLDVLVVARGGGSLEDLWAFNEEAVARAIAASKIPVISAVGHETDVTIADFVADVRAPTPSAAAEIVVARKDEFVARIDRLVRGVSAAMSMRKHRLESRLRALESRSGFAGMRGHLALRGRHADELTFDLRRALQAGLAARERGYQRLRLTLERFDLRRRLAGVKTRLVAADARLQSTIHKRAHAFNARLGASAARLDSLSPLAVLGRGYAVCWNADRTEIIRDAARIENGSRVLVTVEKGELTCEVKDRKL